jgi:hypothetical protein
MTAPERPGAPARLAWHLRAPAAAAALAVILAAGLVPRVPLLLNARASFNSDEAVNALVVQHLLHRGELTFFNWDARYYGIVEGLLSLPFLATGLDVPLASRLGSVAGFLALQVGVFLLGRRLCGTAAGLAAAALLAAFSPQLVLWSALASGGYALVVAWGTFTLLQYDRALRRPSGANLAVLGFMIGFGLYIYELFLVYLAALAAGWLASAWLAPAGLSSARRLERRSSPDAAGPARYPLARAALFALGFALGWAPKIALFLTRAPAAGKRPSYGLAALPAMVSNAKLLLAHCGPSLLGANPAGNHTVAALVGEGWPLARPLGLALLAFYSVAWSAAAWRLARAAIRRLARNHRATAPAAPVPATRRLARDRRTTTPAAPVATTRRLARDRRATAPAARTAAATATPAPAAPAASPAPAAPAAPAVAPGGPPALEAALVLLVPVTAALFVASPNVVGEASNHYLLPLLTSLAPFGACLLVAIGRRAPAAAWALAALLVAVPLAEIGAWYHAPGQFHYLGPGFRLRRMDEPIDRVLRLLDERRIHHAYAGYWLAYRTTLLASERVVVTSLDWDRYPPYRRAVDAAPREAYLFSGAPDPAEAGLRERLRAAGRSWTLASIPPYRIYLPAGAGRLLPAPARVLPLLRPRAEIAAHPPALWRAGAVSSVPVEVRNLGDAAWSAAGQAASGGALRVAVSYHWLGLGGPPGVFEGRRTPLPHDLAPGDAVALAAAVEAPAAPGRYRLCLTLVQEGVAWFDQVGAGAAVAPVEVVAPRHP